MLHIVVILSDVLCCRFQEELDLCATKWLVVTQRRKMFGKTNTTEEDIQHFSKLRHRHTQALVTSTRACRNMKI